MKANNAYHTLRKSAVFKAFCGAVMLAYCLFFLYRLVAQPSFGNGPEMLVALPFALFAARSVILIMISSIFLGRKREDVSESMEKFSKLHVVHWMLEGILIGTILLIALVSFMFSI
jgi:hypothetical protein